MDHNVQLINQKLLIGHWNANGLNENIEELKDFLLEFDIDIMLINETKFTSKNKCKISGYQIYRADRVSNNPGGGVLILAKESIPCCEINLKTKTVESLGIKLANGLLIFSVYLPPSKVIDTAELTKLFQAGSKVIIMGDLNSKHMDWNCKQSNQSGRILHRYIRRLPYVMLVPDKFTHYPYNSNQPSTIDLALLKNINNCISLEALNELDSDHSPLILELDSGNLKNEVDKKFLNYKEANWNKFRQIIQNKLTVNSKLANKLEIDQTTEKLTRIINEAIRVSIPEHSFERKQKPLSGEIRKTIKSRNLVRKLHQKTGYMPYKKLRNKLRNIVRTKIKQERNKEWEQRLEKLTPRDSSLWKLTKFFTKGRDKKVPTLHGPRGLVFTDKEKADTLAEQFERVHHLTEDFGDEQTERAVHGVYNLVKGGEVLVDDIDYVSPREVKKIIKQTKSKKAPGNDGIQNIILKNLPRKATTQLTNIYNACMKISYFPEKWKKADVLSVKKPGKDKLFPQNYRPISLLPTMGKIFEKIILFRILKHESSNKILIPEQFGFRQKRSTVHQLARLTNDISEGFNKNHSTAMLLLDIEKAFDTVWHKGLIFKLYQYKFPSYILKLLISYLKNRIFRTVVNNAHSDEQKVSAGVPQGSILGPVLFIYYINDIPRKENTKIAVFADDTAIFASSWDKNAAVRRIQNHIDELEPYFDKWKIKTNADKFELVIFAHRRIKARIDPVQMNNALIEPKKEAKYLGVLLDSKLTFSSHVNNIRKKSSTAISLLYNLINKNSKLSKSNKVLIYKVIIKPIMLYAAPIWGNTCKTNINKLQTIQNKVLRMVSGAEWRKTNESIRNSLQITELFPVIKDLTKNFYESQIKEIQLLERVGIYTKETAPFKIKYKLPHQLLIM